VGRGALQGVSAGFSDEAIGGAQAFFDKYIKNNPEALVELYRRHRDEERAKNQAAQEAHPLAYVGGGVAGGVGLGALTGGASLPATVGYGAANALGESNADLTKGDTGQALKDTATGAVAGGLLHGAGKVVGGVGKALFKGGAESVEEQGAKALGFTPGHIGDLKLHGELPGVIAAAEKDGVFSNGIADVGTLQKKFQAAADARIGAIGNSVSKADAEGKTMNLSALRRDLEQRQAGLSEKLSTNNPDALKAYSSVVERLKEREQALRGAAQEISPEEIKAQLKAGVKPQNIKATGGATVEGNDVHIPISEAHGFKQDLQMAAKQAYDDSSRGPPAGAALKDIASTTRAHTIQGAGGANSEYAQALANSEPYMASRMSQLKDSTMKMAGAAGGIGSSLTAPAAVMSAVSGHPMGAAALVAGSVMQRQVRQRAQSAAYWLAKKSSGDGGVSMAGKLAQLITQNPAVLGHYAGVLSQALAHGGEDKLNQTHYVLSQTDPKYRSLMENVHASNEEDLGGLSPADEATSE